MTGEREVEKKSSCAASRLGSNKGFNPSSAGMHLREEETEETGGGKGELSRSTTEADTQKEWRRDWCHKKGL